MTTTREALVAVGLVVLTGAGAAAVTPAQKCQQAKNTEAGIYASCRQKVEGRFALTNDAARRTAALQKCVARYAKKWPIIESTAGGACPSTGDQAAIQGVLDYVTTNVATELAGGGLADCAADLATCSGDLPTCLANLAACEAAPKGRPLKTGQTVCYDAAGFVVACAGSGQDGEFTKGLARAYVDNGDGTITDTSTGLMWEKLSDDGTIHDVDDKYTWANAFTGKIAALNAGPGFAGHADWRLPNVLELSTLGNLGTHTPAVSAPFNTACANGCTVLTCSCTAPEAYWSSTSDPNGSSFARIGDFFAGLSGSSPKTNPRCVRAVRGG